MNTEIYDAEKDLWSSGPLLKHPVYTIPCLIDLGNSENLIITTTNKGNDFSLYRYSIIVISRESMNLQ